MNTAPDTPATHRTGRWLPNWLSWLSWLVRLWPQTLSGRIAAILVIGMLAAQAMTGTIWWEMRRSQLLDVPLRLVAARSADTLALLQASPPEQRAALLAQWQGSRYQLQWVDAPDATQTSPYPEAQALMDQVISERLGHPVPLQLQQLALLGERTAEATAVRCCWPTSPKPMSASCCNCRTAPGCRSMRRRAKLASRCSRCRHWPTMCCASTCCAAW
ncbi:hypothetical protein [Comamonas piscis]|uniref:hypothetical protein n=1 Tax=Comamonas piscis TaxID=1562974 RepID=UPI001EE2C55A|nr:hypothetical protein [Comamonas piscis]WSO34648.1 hypothetical protein VUJ63_03185 [Comamonas piscis]